MYEFVLVKSNSSLFTLGELASYEIACRSSSKRFEALLPVSGNVSPVNTENWFIAIFVSVKSSCEDSGGRIRYRPCLELKINVADSTLAVDLELCICSSYLDMLFVGMIIQL